MSGTSSTEDESITSKYLQLSYGLTIPLFHEFPILALRLKSLGGIRLFCACVGLLLFSCFTQAQTNHCSIQWDGTIKISTGDCATVSPQVVAVGNTLHVLWLGMPGVIPCDGINFGGIIYANSSDGGKTFSSPKRLQSYDSAYGNAGVLSAAGENIFVLYSSKAEPPMYESTALMRSTDVGENWKLIGDFGYHPYNGFATQDSSVWINFQYYDTTVKGGVFISHDLGESFDTVKAELPYVFTSGVKRVAATSRGVHIVSEVFDSQFRIEFWQARSPDFGYHWSSPETLSALDNVTSQLPRMVATEEGIYVVWQDYKFGNVGGYHGSILLRMSTDEGITWGQEQALTKRPSGSRPSVAAFRNFVSVAWSEYLDDYHDKTMVRISNDFGRSWCDMVEVDSLGGDVDVELNNDFIFITWFRDDGIFFRRGRHAPADARPIPEKFVIYQNYPNPFNTSTRIGYSVSSSEHVEMKIYDLLGRQITTLVNEWKAPGHYEVDWNASDISSGAYVVKVRTSSSNFFTKMLLMK